MAIATAEAVAEVLSTSNVATYDFGAFTPSANSFLMVVSRTTATVIGSIRDTGALLSWTKHYEDLAGPTILAYWAQPNGSPASTTIRVDHGADPGTACTAVAFSVTGHNRANPIRQFKLATGGAGTTPAVTFDAATLTQNSILLVVINSDTAPALTPPTSFTEIADGGVSAPTVGIEACFLNTGGTASTYTWGTASVSAWTVLAFEINEADQGHAFWAQCVM